MKINFVILSILFSIINSSLLYSQTIGQGVPSDVEFKNFLSQANIFLLKGDQQNALSCLLTCLKYDPKSAVCNYQIAKIYLDREDYDAALNYGLSAHMLNPSNKWYANFVATVFDEVGDYNNALKYYNIYLSENPSYEDYLAFQDFQVRFHKIDDAIATVDRIEKTFGFDVDLCLLRAKLYEGKKDINKAADEYKRLIRTDSTDLQYLGLLAELYLNNGKLAEAQEVQNYLSKFYPNDSYSYLSQAMLCLASGKKDCFYQNLNESFKCDKFSVSEMLSMIADVVRTSKTEDEEKIKNLFQTLSDFHPESSSVHINFADYAMFINDIDKAVEQLEMAIAADKSCYSCFQKVFILYVVTENYEKLRSCVDEALEYFPDVAEVILYSAVADMYLGNYSSAEDNFAMSKDFGIDYSPSSFLYFYYYGIYNYLIGKKDIAFDLLNQSYKNGLVNWYLILRYVYCLVDSHKDLAFAKQLLVELNKEPRKYFYFYYVSAYYNMTIGNSNAAFQCISKAIEMDKSKKYYVLELAGDIYNMLGDCNNSIKYWKEAIEMGGSSKDINKKIENCK